MHSNAVKIDRPPSIISTINTGFQALHRRLWILVLPVILDLLLWASPRVSPQPFVSQLIGQVPNLAQQLQPQIDARRTLGIAYDLRIDGNILNRLGSLIGTVPVPAFPMGQPVWHIGSGLVLLGAVVAINLLGLLLSAIYLLLLGDAVRTTVALGPWLRRLFSTFIRLAGVVGIWLGVALASFAPFFIVGGVVALFAPVVGIALVTLGAAVVLWMLFTAQFAFDAVVISGASPPRALLSSVLVVRRWFWSAVGLLLITYLITAGMAVIWQGLARLGLAGLLIAIAGSAYMSAGLVAAHLVFYRDRVPPPGAVRGKQESQA